MTVLWKPDMSVGLPEIDEDHRQLLRIFNEFSAAAEAGQGPEHLAATLEQLIRYVSYHFRHEENFFMRTNYPDYAIHKAEHERWMARVSDLYVDARSKPPSQLAQEVDKMLHDFVYQHVMTVDRKFGLYFNTHNFVL